jgi:hypothetical protein
MNERKDVMPPHPSTNPTRGAVHAKYQKVQKKVRRRRTDTLKGKRKKQKEKQMRGNQRGYISLTVLIISNTSIYQSALLHAKFSSQSRAAICSLIGQQMKSSGL